MVFDPRKLIDLRVIAQHGTFGKAARARGVSQPALSNSIAILERSLDVRLLERSRRGVTLTEYGRMLIARAETLDALTSATLEEIRLHKAGLQGSLRIGVSPVASVSVVPAAIARMQREAPDVAIEIIEMQDEGLIDGLRSGWLDLTVSPTGTVKEPADIERQPLWRDRLVLIASPDNPIARRRSTLLRQVQSATFVMPTSDSAMLKYIEALFSAANIPWPANCIATNSVAVIKMIVSTSDCVAIVSNKIVELEVGRGELVTVPLRDRTIEREICVRLRKSRIDRPAVSRILRCIRG